MKAYLMTRVGTVADIDEIAKLGWVDLFVLGRNQETSHSNQLKFWTGNLLALEVSINQVDGKVQRLWNKLELQMNFHKPIDENGAHAFINVRLTLHKDGADRGKHLLAAKVFVHILNVFSGAQRIFFIAFVNVVNLSSVLIAVGVGDKAGSLHRDMMSKRWDNGLGLTHDRYWRSGYISVSLLHQRFRTGSAVDIAFRIGNILL